MLEWGWIEQYQSAETHLHPSALLKRPVAYHPKAIAFPYSREGYLGELLFYGLDSWAAPRMRGTPGADSTPVARSHSWGTADAVQGD